MYAKKTRCPHCKTLYRITIDQLTISHGQVLCGDCQLMFNAIEHLQMMDTVNTNFTPVQISHHTVVPSHQQSPKYHIWEQQDANAMIHPEILKFFQQKTQQSPVSLVDYLNKLGE